MVAEGATVSSSTKGEAVGGIEQSAAQSQQPFAQRAIYDERGQQDCQAQIPRRHAQGRGEALRSLQQGDSNR